MKTIPLTRGKVALVDDEDYERLMRYQWFACVSKDKKRWYARRNLRTDANGRRGTVPMHREITSAPKDCEVDHRDHDGLNNQRHNLRVCSKTDNQRNRRAQSGTSLFKGAHWVTQPGWKGGWRAQIRVNGKSIHLGTFSTDTEAARAYDAAALKYFGEFAAPNFPSLEN